MNIFNVLFFSALSVSRILSISAVASAFPVYTGIACAVHWLAMTLWLSIWERTQFCKVTDQSTLIERLTEVTFCAILGLVYIFTYLTPSDGSTRNRYLVYYPVCFVENAAAIFIWSITADSSLTNSWYFVPFIISGIVPFLIGIIFMIIYYKFFHPETSRKIGVSNNYIAKDPVVESTTQTEGCRSEDQLNDVGTVLWCSMLSVDLDETDDDIPISFV